MRETNNRFLCLGRHSSFSIYLFIVILFYFQGDLSQQEKRAVFLTVHDLGCNRKLSNSEKHETESKRKNWNPNVDRKIGWNVLTQLLSSLNRSFTKTVRWHSGFNSIRFVNLSIHSHPFVSHRIHSGRTLRTLIESICQSPFYWWRSHFLVSILRACVGNV